MLQIQFVQCKIFSDQTQLYSFIVGLWFKTQNEKQDIH